MVKILIKRLSSKVTMPQYKTIGSSGMDIAAFLDNEILIERKYRDLPYLEFNNCLS